MSDRCLVVLEVSQKQNFIFRANELKQNVGASMIVRYVTEEIGDIFCKDEEFFFAGGGKSVYDFASREDAVAFVEKVSKKAIVSYPGIELFAGLAEYDEDERMPDVMNRAFAHLNQKKSERKGSYRLDGIGLARTSPDSAMPVADKDGNTEGLSAEGFVKEQFAVRPDQIEYFKKYLPEGDYAFPFEFDELGVTKNSKSYIAVIVVDGNRMGKKFSRFSKIYDEKYKDADVAAVNEEYKRDYRELSDAVDEIYNQAVLETNRIVAACLDWLIEDGVVSDKRDIHDKVLKKKVSYLPVRPIVVAGDDICIVTDARIGLSYARILLSKIKEFSQGKQVAGVDLNMKACAGVAMVKSHYPFFRAHELAEDLCNNAKKKIDLPREDDLTGEKGNASIIDFHIVQGEIEGSVKEIRDEKYDGGDLTGKPYFLSGKNTRGLHAWDELIHRIIRLKQGTDDSEKKDKSASIGRGTLKEYRQALQDGEVAMVKFRNHKRIDRSFDDWNYDRGMDFDAIEIMDLYHDLEKYK